MAGQQAWIKWSVVLWIGILATLLTGTVEAFAEESKRNKAERILWEAYYYGNVPDGELPGEWRAISDLDLDKQGSRAGSELWLRADLPPEQHRMGNLLISDYKVHDYEIAVFVGEEKIFTSKQVLPSGFITSRVVSYQPGDSQQSLLVRISPHQHVEKGFEVWVGSSAALFLKQLQREGPAWAGAAALLVLSLLSLIGYGFQRSQPVLLYFSCFLLSLAVSLATLWGSWQHLVTEESLGAWGTFIHFNWYMGHASGILITHAIVATGREKWLRRTGYGIAGYAVVGTIGTLLFGEQVQQFFYTLFYDYLSTVLLVVIMVVLLIALKRRRDWEVRLFALGNALFLVGVVTGRLINGQIVGASSPTTILTARDALIQIGWTFVGFTAEIACVSIIIGMRFLRLVQLSSTNAALNEANTRLRISNDKLERMDKIRSNMYSEVSHELNTPITSIKGYVQLMLKGTIPAGDPRYLNIIYEKSQAMERTVDDMLEMARLENKQIHLENERLDLSAFLDQLCSKWELSMAERGLDFSWALPPQPAVPGRTAALHADPMRVEQVLVNLLSNAQKFSQSGGIIRVEASLEGLGPEPDTVLIRVRDSGCGIAVEEQDHIFERYYRGKAAKANAISGIGLGLSICRMIMQAQQGEIGLEHSSSEGSTFYLIFPLYWMEDE
ncbi:sensor histidine kinase [Paenibacillus daejeonensis]|uniref:sensor histidine kinase n=1 Tax=Paenibacillus daejeonensis TaxID=135193 RepID=UPI0003723BC8|nr:HAMP domain-containing sensor histidine kinase [Paenibacillus daejeonensis]